MSGMWCGLVIITLLLAGVLIDWLRRQERAEEAWEVQAQRRHWLEVQAAHNRRRAEEERARGRHRLADWYEEEAAACLEEARSCSS